MSLHAPPRRAFVFLGLLAAIGCNQQTLQQGFEADQFPPFVAIDKTAGDTLVVSDGIQFGVIAQDNLGVKDVSVTLSVGFDFQFDTTFATAITDVTLDFGIPLPTNTTAGGVILISAAVTDGNNNTSTAVDSVFLRNDAALTVRILDPLPGGVTSPGLQIPVNIQATQSTGVRKVGYSTTGVLATADSLTFALPDTALFQTSLTVPANTQVGTFTIVGFAEDSSGRRVNSSPVAVSVQTVVSDAVPPFVRFTVASRVEVTDSIVVTATDPSGVNSVSWQGLDLNGNVVGGGNLASAGNLTQLTGRFQLGFLFTTFPQLVEIRAFGTDQAGNTGEARVDTSATSAILRDTITVVNGITKPLPAGGQVADAVYNRTQNEFYLTNVTRNRLEIFRVADTSYVAGGISVGSVPFGLAMWPQDTLGNYRDTVIVANSGGTNLSIVDVRPAVRREVRRHRLPNFLIQSIQTEIDPATSTIKIKVEEYDFSDRPQYVGATCRPTGGGTACAADSIFVIYSTTPTPGQTTPFTNRGTVRWENITAAIPHSHFFWEHAAVVPSPDADSLQILVDRGPTVAIDTVLSVAKGITVDLGELPFQDVTFVRSSGNATHALIGEGQEITNARAIGYNGNRLLLRTTDTTVIINDSIIGPTEVDFGVSAGIRVRDFIANTSTQVKSIAINFNGLTNMVRADSVYVLDENLRLAGLLPVGGENAGMDLNFQHAFDPFIGGTAGTFGGTADPNLRMVFLARPDANIDVYDTFFFERVTSIPIRDPIIGPVRVALLPSGDQILVGVTARGVVTVRFPQIPNTFPGRIAGGGPGQ